MTRPCAALLITDRRQGKWIFYSLNPEAIESTALLLDRMLFQPARQLKAAGGGPIRQHPACTDDAESDYGLCKPDVSGTIAIK
jgi:DNA-binding transcriptional ArsR family regulator